MAALTTDTPNLVASGSYKKNHPISDIVKSGKTMYAGAVTILEHGTGHVRPADDAADATFAGIWMHSSVAGDGSLEGAVNPESFILYNAAVTGLTAQSKVPEPVYAGTDDNSLTLTRPTDDAVPVGVTTKYRASGFGDVLVFGRLGSHILRLAGGDKVEVSHGIFNLADLANSQVIGLRTLYGHGKIVATKLVPVKAATTGSKAATLTPDINGAALTGGVLAATSANMTPSGTALDGTAVSAGNEFHDGDILKYVVSSVTAFAEGTAELITVIQRLP